METKLAYYRRRASEEYVAHANASHPERRKSHLELAKHFEALALQTKVEPETPEADAARMPTEPPVGCH